MTASPAALLQQRYGLMMTPLFRQVGPDAIDHEGSGVLVATNCRWLFTAAHVVSKHDVLFLPGRPQMVLRKERFGISPDFLDLAFLELSPAEVENLERSGLRFVPFEALDLSTEELPPDRDGCLIAGFPGPNVDVDGDNRTIRAGPTVVTSQFLSARERMGLRLEGETQIVAKFGGLREGGRKLNRFKPDGISGSGIWRNEAGEPRLVGIATDYDPGRRIVIGTRLRPMLQEILRHLRDDP